MTTSQLALKWLKREWCGGGGSFWQYTERLIGKAFSRASATAASIKRIRQHLRHTHAQNVATLELDGTGLGRAGSARCSRGCNMADKPHTHTHADRYSCVCECVPRGVLKRARFSLPFLSGFFFVFCFIIIILSAFQCISQSRGQISMQAIQLSGVSMCVRVCLTTSYCCFDTQPAVLGAYKDTHTHTRRQRHGRHLT